MQNTVRLGLVLLFLLITVKSQAALAPGKESIWPEAKTLVPDRVELSLLDIQSMDLNKLSAHLKKIENQFPKQKTSKNSSTGLPKNFLESAHQLRELEKIGFNDEKLKQVILNFFGACSKDEKILSTLNSLCLSHALKLSPQGDKLFSKELYSKKTWKLAQLAL